MLNAPEKEDVVTIDEEIASDWAKIKEKYAEPKIEEPAREAAPEPEKEPRSRDAEGKFKAAEEPKSDLKVKTAPTKDDLPNQPAKGADQEPEPSTEQPQRDINRAPSTWKPAARSMWDKVDPAIRAEIHRRESDFQNGQAQLIPDATMGRELRQVIDPYRAMIEAEGGTPARAVADLFRTAAIFRTGTQAQKLQAIAVVADQFRVDLTPLLNAVQARNGGQPAPQGQQPQGQPQQFRDPRVDQILQQQNEEKRIATQREQQQTESAVTRWMNEMDAQGNPKREYLNDVINEMSALVPQIRAADPSMTHVQALDAAYDRAIWAHPEIRTLLANKQQADLDAKRKAENQARVADARRAGSVNVPRRGSIPSPGKPGKMEDTIEEAARALGMIS